MIGIYKITNEINGKCYIGQSIDIDKRWKEHKTVYNHPRCSHYHIYKAFRKYGIENFSFIVIEECQQSLLNEREKYWIEYYDSFNNGYNMTVGGEGTEVIERDLVYELWDKGLTVNNIANNVQCSSITIQRILHNYEKYSTTESFLRRAAKFKKPITQYGMDGHSISYYDSIIEASRITHIPADGISACCNGRLKSAGGYQWAFGMEENINCYEDVIIYKNGKPKRVAQYTKSNEFIDEYESILDAQRKTGIGRLIISRACNGIQKYGAGYIWKFAS